VWLLLALLAMAAVSCHYGFRRPPPVSAGRLQAAFLLTVCMLIPLVSYALALQSGAQARLARLGIEPHPAIRHVVGIAAGQGDWPIWVFATRGGGDAALGFYDDPARHRDWEVLERGAKILVLGRGDARLSVSSSGSGARETLIYQAMR
jgi:hypothetical protein